MRPDVDDLQSFYQSRQGQLARRLILHQIKALWPDLRGRNVMGFGYAAPFLAGLDGAARTIALMPAQQGAVRWPQDSACRTALVREEELPLADGSVDRVLLVHALECCTNVPRLIREIWRVLADGGRLIAIVPNRRGLWCLSDRTPFGYGQPYSAAQLQRTLNSHLFSACAERTALFLPPTRSRLFLRLAIPAERLGLGFARQLAGVVLIEAEKQIYVGTPLPALSRSRVRRYMPVAEGLVAARDTDEVPVPADRGRGRSARVVPLPQHRRR
ncbi:class I SAM-dependent methyltransferase [Benzoatithermus flavus]|uniref:Class I SAM-dependent methyltransferase n=1 Tax=Benzoatithermus flavus TaxID=3108223 RepID=A0ABU8XTG7_9PROT